MVVTERTSTMGGISRRRQSKAVTIAYASIAAILLLIIAAVAMVIVPPAPPSVSEFAPQAQEQIDQALDKQSSQFGKGAGACASGQVCEGSNVTSKLIAPSKRIVEKARIRRCVGDPPRQTEDPQSPPCVNYWEGENGGSTTKGVTRDEIRVALWSNITRIQPLVDHFNSRYEFYGRKIRLLQTGTGKSGAFDASDPKQQQAAAVGADEELDAFASLSLEYNSDGDQRTFYAELARRHVIGASVGASYRLKADFARARPYNWAWEPPLDSVEANVGEFACNSLVGEPARFAGPQYVNSSRRFAILYPKPVGDPPEIATLQKAVEGCGGGPVFVSEFENSSAEQPTGPSNSILIARMQQAGITSGFCICAMGHLSGSLMHDANLAGYQPEWVLAGLDMLEYSGYQLAPPEQRIHLFGVGSRNKVFPAADSPWWWAAKEGGATEIRAFQVARMYRELLILASGVQMAGQRLTPQTFEAGLFRGRFPNPGAAGPPYWQATVGFGPGDWSMSKDFPLIWWDNTAEAYDEAPSYMGGKNSGNFCYLNRGARWSLGRWPKGELPFLDRTQPCR